MDYTEISDQTLSFDVLSIREVCIDITVNDDDVFEEDEQFQLTLSQTSPPPTFPPVTIDPALSTVTILDNDSKQYYLFMQTLHHSKASVKSTNNSLAILSVATVGFNPTTYSTDEGGSALILVQLFTTIARSVSVNFRTVDGTAVSTLNGDYTPEERTITFEPAGSTIVFIPVQTATDNLPEQTETFTAELFQAEPAGRVTISEDTATVEITDTSGRQ